jgi:Zn-dependent protease
MNLSPDVLQNVIGQLIILILSVAVHEFGHAFVADRLGDRLPRQQGRVTLNPIAHADPIGTLALPVIGLLATGGASTGFGWGKPVQVNPIGFTRKLRMRTGHMLVALAGPMMNLLFGVFIALVYFALWKGGVSMPHKLDMMIRIAVMLNFVLMIFNLLPAPPLDGGSVIRGLLPDRMLRRWDDLSKYGLIILFAFILIPTLGNALRWPAMQLYHGLFTLLGIPA